VPTRRSGGSAIAARGFVEGRRSQAWFRPVPCVRPYRRAVAYGDSENHRPFLETPTQRFRDYHEAYVCVLAELVQLIAPGMKARGAGRIVTILSSAIAENPPKMAAYVTAKTAALGLCRALAAELGPSNITVNAISPSMVVGRHGEDVGGAAREVMMRKAPLRRLAHAEDVSRAVQFLLSDGAGFISGAHR
jgi:3-oxoacyl-[acyl-carrier protein] reductase